MPIQYVQVNGSGLDHDHQIETTAKLIGGDRYRCVAQGCHAVFERHETGAPGADRRARQSSAARAEAVRQAAAAKTRRRNEARRRRWRRIRALLLILAASAVLLYLGSR